MSFTSGENVLVRMLRFFLMLPFTFLSSLYLWFHFAKLWHEPGRPAGRGVLETLMMGAGPFLLCSYLALWWLNPPEWNRTALRVALGQVLVAAAVPPLFYLFMRVMV